MHRRVIQLEPWHTSPSQRWVPQLGMYSLSSCTVISVVNLKSAIVHKITHPEHADDQQTTLDTHILRPFRVDIARKLLVEYQPCQASSLDFHFWQSIPQQPGPALWPLFEYLDPRSVKSLTENTLQADCMRGSGRQ